MTVVNQGLSACECVLARLDAALQIAAAEVESSSAAEQRIALLMSRLLDVQGGQDAETRAIRLAECTPKQPANENDYDSGVFEMLHSPSSGFGGHITIANAM